jgi:hypothetical protein
MADGEDNVTFMVMEKVDSWLHELEEGNEQEIKEIEAAALEKAMDVLTLQQINSRS